MEINKPIPLFESIDGWQNIQIIENSEEMINLNSFSYDHIDVQPKYFLQNFKHANQEQYVRKSVAFKLLEVAKLLPVGYKLRIWDAWRPFEVQKAIFEKVYNQIKSRNTYCNEDEIIKESLKFVSAPSKNKEKPAWHSTGGSIDLTIINAEGIELLMGTDFDDISLKARSDYYEILSNNDGDICFAIVQRNRRLLYNLLISVGFTNYPEEWWHFDFGNQLWGKISGNTAFYNYFEI